MSLPQNQRWAFINDQPDGQWTVVIVGHTDRCPPESGHAEALDWRLFPTFKDAHAWADHEFGPLPRVDN